MSIIDKIFKGSRLKRFFSYTKLDENALNWSSSQFLKAYEISAYVYGAVKKRAEKVGEIEFRLEDSKTGEDLPNDHPILLLLARPNKYQTKNEFCQLYQTYKDLTGEAYIYILRLGEGKDQKIEELHLLRPDFFVKHEFNEQGDIVNYIFSDGKGGDKKYPATDIIASRNPNPLDRFRGLSPLVAGALAVDTENQLSIYHNKVLKNGGKVEGILNFRAELTPAQIKEVKDNFDAHFAGADKAGKPLVTYGDAEYTNLGLTPSELSYLESKKMTRDDILLIYGVPKAIVAQTDDVNYANAKTGKEIFLSETIRPLLQDLTEKLDQFLVPENLTLTFEDPTPEDIDATIKQIDCGARNYYLTINEMRELAGYEPLDGGDVMMIPFNLTPVEKPSEFGNEPDLTKGIKKKGPACRMADETMDECVARKIPEIMEENPGMDNDQAYAIARSVCSKPCDKSKTISHPLKNKDFRRKYHAGYLRRLEKQKREMLKAIKRIIRGQKSRILDKLDDKPNYKSAFKRKNQVDDYFDLSIEMNIAKESITPFLEKFAIEAGSDSFKLFNIGKPYVLSAQVKSTLEKRATLFAIETTNTTLKQLQRAFSESIDNSETRDQLVDRISNVFDGISKGRAGVIADTETQVANQTGNFDSYKSAGVPIKIWVSVLDDSTRESHESIDGEERLLDVPFSNGLQYPGDPSGEASEVINCRCTI